MKKEFKGYLRLFGFIKAKQKSVEGILKILKWKN
jgi:hypothetical protein